MDRLGHLLGRLAALEVRVRDAVAARRAADPAPDDAFRGLYLSDEAIDALLDAPRQPFPAPPEGAGLLPAAAGLTALDTELLLVAVAPDVDSRFEQFYGYLNDDVTRRRCTAGLALRLCGLPEAVAAGRARLDADAPLLAAGLIVVEDPGRPFLSRTLRLPDRVVGYLLGDDRPDPQLRPLLDEVTPVPGLPDVDLLVRALGSGAGLAYLQERAGGSGPALAVSAFDRMGRPALSVDAVRLAGAPELAGPLLREALLTGAGVVLGPLDGVDVGACLEAFSRVDVPLVLYGTGGWDPRWSKRPALRLDAETVPPAVRAAVWRSTLDGRLAPGVDPAEVTAHFNLGPPQIRRAAEAAVLSARAVGGPVTADLLRRGARGQNAAGLERLARRVEPAVDWPDLVLPPAVLGQLRELAARAHHRDRVLDQWRMRPGGGRGRGLTGLFAGDSGTGKTMSAEVVAHSLGLDLYTVNLATVVDKYVGETEKNLERIFTEAAGVNGVLLFDEADAIFGKRSEVRDAHDRYANIESAYLLQRMETFDGIAILATNLRANLDEAFTRRLDVVVDFPLPDVELRRALWDRCLGTALPRSNDLDLAFLATAFELAGGHIRSAAVTAAYLAADADRPVGMADLIGAVAREYRKLGRLCLDREFGPYLALTG
ncbi:ATP-binding protein [Couchioplanes azureus]|uniref:ATP-binding protein n=1 Tax=Couchioplanes caeruleus TaxID=56438 RepID=UPI00166F730F|nr:ATP-binding protein [Couchioplanes caeruleus]GGQ82564.1 ATPase [Couchioplanes caeruleus subsp. azureus]